MTISGPNDRSKIEREIEIETWSNLIQEIYPNDESLNKTIQVLKIVLNEKIQSENDFLSVPVDQLEKKASAIQQRNIQLIKVKSFIEEMQSYLSLLNSLTSSMGDGIHIASQEKIIPEDSALVGAHFKSITGEISKISGNVTLAVDTLDCIFRTVRYTQLLHKVKKNLDAIDTYLKSLSQSAKMKLNPEDIKRFRQAQKQYDFFVKDHGEKLQNNIFFLSTSWSRFLLATTNTILQNVGVSSAITASLSWAGSILGIITSSVKFHQTRAKNEFRLETLKNYYDEQFSLNLEETLSLNLEEIPTSAETKALKDESSPNEIKENSKYKTEDTLPLNIKQIKILLNKRKEEELAALELKSQNASEVADFAEKEADSPRLFKQLIHHFGVNPPLVMEAFINSFLQKLEKKIKSHLNNCSEADVKKIVAAYSIALAQRRDVNEQDLVKLGLNLDLLGTINAIEKQLLAQFQIDKAFLIQKYIISDFGLEENASVVDIQLAHKEFLNLLKTNPAFKEQVGIAYTQFKRTQSLQALKSANALNLEKNSHEGKVADFNYKKTSALFAVSLAISKASLILSILLFCSVLGALPAIVFAVAPLLLLLASATALIVGIHFIKKRRPSLYAKIYPAKIRYFGGVIVELIRRLHLHHKKLSFTKFVKQHNFKIDSSGKTIFNRSPLSEKVQLRYQKFLEELALLTEKLNQRKQANDRLSALQSSYKLHDYAQAVKLDERIHYDNPHSLQTPAADFKQELQKNPSLYDETMVNLGKVFFHPNVPVSNEVIEFFEIKMGINLTLFMDETKKIRVDQYPTIGKALGSYFAQDEDDLLSHMGKIKTRKEHMARLLGEMDKVDTF